MGNILGCRCGTKEIKALVAEETSTNDIVNLVVKSSSELPQELVVKSSSELPEELVVKSFSEIPEELVVKSSSELAEELVVKSFSELPEELVVHILCNLPVESLVRIKTVCKPWKVLIESQSFIDIHLRRKNLPLRPINVHLRLEPRENFCREKHPLNYLPVRNGNIAGACNGIICLQPCLPEKRIILWNPSLKEFSYVPGELNGNWVGFCYLSETQEYRIISFSLQCLNNNVDIITLTLGKNKSRRDVKDVKVPGRMLYGRKHATSGTTIVWLGYDGRRRNEIVICYDVIEERFSKMLMPPSPLSPLSTNKSLTILHGSVIMFVYPKVNSTSFDMWMLIDDVSMGKSWRKYRKVGPLETGLVMKPIDVCSDNRWILCGNEDIDKDYKSDNLFFYDLKTAQVDDHKFCRIPTLECINYIESLVSIKSLGIDTNYY